MLHQPFGEILVIKTCWNWFQAVGKEWRMTWGLKMGHPQLCLCGMQIVLALAQEKLLTLS